jgi:hypothetical protein
MFSALYHFEKEAERVEADTAVIATIKEAEDITE